MQLIRSRPPKSRLITVLLDIDHILLEVIVLLAIAAIVKTLMF